MQGNYWNEILSHDNHTEIRIQCKSCKKVVFLLCTKLIDKQNKIPVACNGKNYI